MTEPATDTQAPAEAPGTRRGQHRFRLHSGSAIVPRESVAGQALAVVIAIMAFLASITVGGVSVIADSSVRWQSDIAREVTVQIRPFDDQEMDEAVRQTSRLLLTFDGIEKVTALDAESSAELLEPWLGSGLDLAELPVPRLLTVSVAAGATPDFEAIEARLEAEVPAASLDDHRVWAGRLATMALTMAGIGVGVLILVLTATVLSVVFATKGAMAGNKAVIDVLHFVGAEPAFIAGQFQRHFLLLALRGAVAGGMAAALLLAMLGLWSIWNRNLPQAEQLEALFGTFSVSLSGYLGIIAVIVAIALLAAATSRFIALRHIQGLEAYRGSR